MSTPPLPGKGLSVKVDQQLYDDLMIMMRAGNTVSDAVKEAVSLIAGTYRNAWAMGAYPEGVLPQVIACQVRPYDWGMTAGVPRRVPQVPAGVPGGSGTPRTRVPGVPRHTAGSPASARTDSAHHQVTEGES
ncbi:hypothetical protein [Streptomyces sp. NPDC048462]|uniref:hypothetical protein n=1 Tax=Streptomyces sp. NPDC048462 TaxID=3365555 RepID=UPI00371AEE9A